ncbi:dUTP diphosphatase [Halobacillus litoralis]|uniref:dUTPase n=1 Tax=Halobacillus litoralis TaxID=45668 RepID=A0A410MH48_9BACI|nr:dUTP diphosphatase [Halobacillus litoralis]QAS53985.1 dUTPase [Halobacillus litoralis]
MNWEPLYLMQRRLDQYIENQHQLQKGEKVEEKILALLVEVGELANETRCFKFWSTKGPSEKQVILEEYVDGVHFLLSLGIDLEFMYHSEHTEAYDSQTDAFLSIYKSIEQFRLYKNEETYMALFHEYLQLGLTLGLTEGELIKAYEDKNQVNFKRQDEGY